MNKFLLPSIAALALSGGIAMAQSTYQSTTTTTDQVPVAVPRPVPPPSGTLSQTQVTRTDNGLGTKTYSSKTTYGNPNHVASQSTQTTVTQPPPVQQTYKRTTTTSSSN